MNNDIRKRSGPVAIKKAEAQHKDPLGHLIAFSLCRAKLLVAVSRGCNKGSGLPLVRIGPDV